MPVSSLVLHLNPDPELRARAVSEIEAHSAFLLGEPTQRLLPAALQTEDEGQNKSCWRWLSALPGVDFVEVLSVVFPQTAQPSPLEGLSTRPSEATTLKRARAGA
jgi:hypothetical protein